MSFIDQQDILEERVRQLDLLLSKIKEVRVNDITPVIHYPSTLLVIDDAFRAIYAEYINAMRDANAVKSSNVGLHDSHGERNE